MEDLEFTLLRKRIENLFGLDLDSYKPGQMRRRLDSFIANTGAESVAAFARQLDADPALREALRDVITINVTEFFRDEPQWKFFEDKILPGVLERAHRPRIWSAGCSIGAKPYTVAMLLAERGATAAIDATDFDPRALAKAKNGGPYRTDEIRGVPPPLLKKYLESEGDLFRIRSSIRGVPRFREMNLLTDNFKTGYDLIICRNVVIYFTDDVKSELFSRFRDALAPDGVLFLGATETMLNAEKVGFTRQSGNFFRRVEDAAQRVA